MLRHRMNRRMIQRCRCRIPVRQEPGQAAVPARREGAAPTRGQPGQTCHPTGRTCWPGLHCVPLPRPRRRRQPAPWATHPVPAPVPAPFRPHPEGFPRPRAELPRDQGQPRKEDLPARRQRPGREAEVERCRSEDRQRAAAPVQLPGRPRLQGLQQPAPPRPSLCRRSPQREPRQWKGFPPESPGPARERS